MPLPAKRLPQDIIREIFTYFSERLILGNLLHRFPWFLGHICSEWRRIFVGMTPEFWSDIIINWFFFIEHLMVNPRPSAILIEQVVKLFLKRNAGRPFSFKFSLAPTDRSFLTPEGQRFAHGILDLFIRESARWRTAALKIGKPDAEALHRVRNRLPLLQKLELSAEPSDDSLADIFLSAPSLASVSMREMSTWRFEWSALTSFRMDGKRVDDFLAALPQMHRLERLQVNSRISFNQVKDYTTTITLPFLVFLKTNETGWLPILEAPELVTWVIEYDFEAPRGRPVDASFLQKSRNTLQRLILQLWRADAFTKLLSLNMQHLPKVKHLGLNFPLHTVDTLDWLVLVQGRLFPNLQSIRILSETSEFKDEDVDAIYNFVASRAKLVEKEGIKPLRLLTAASKSSPHMKQNRLALEKVRVLCEELGVQYKLEVSSSPGYRYIGEYGYNCW